jgi:hypothetical protein
MSIAADRRKRTFFAMLNPPMTSPQDVPDHNLDCLVLPAQALCINVWKFQLRLSKAIRQVRLRDPEPILHNLPFRTQNRAQLSDPILRFA